MNRTYLYEILKEFGIPPKLVKSIKMTSQDSNGKLKTQGQLTSMWHRKRLETK